MGCVPGLSLMLCCSKVVFPKASPGKATAALWMNSKSSNSF